MGRYRDGGADYSPFEDDYRGFEIRDDETARGPLILALARDSFGEFGPVLRAIAAVPAAVALLEIACLRPPKRRR